MSLLDLLRKLGILRWGAESAVYRDATERPLSLTDEDEFDSKKDVIELKPRSREDGENKAAAG